jgi:ABC-type multidrug transport system fused ATPase/permease subunit
MLYQKLLEIFFKRPNLIIVFYIFFILMFFLGWQFGSAQLARPNDHIAEQYKIIFTIAITACLTAIIPFLINSYIDPEVKQEIQKTKRKLNEEHEELKKKNEQEIQETKRTLNEKHEKLKKKYEQNETSEGIKAKQQLELIALYTDENPQVFIESVIDLEAVLPNLRDEVRRKQHEMSKIVQDISARDEAIKILTTKDEGGQDLALRLAGETTIDEPQLEKYSKAIKNTIGKEVYICLGAWLVTSLKNGAPIQPHLIKFSEPNNKDIYKSALKRVYEDIIHRESIPELSKNTEAKRVITEYLKHLVEII